MRRLAAQLPELLTQFPNLQNAIGRWNLQPVLEVMAVGLRGGGEAPDRHAGTTGGRTNRRHPIIVPDV